MINPVDIFLWSLIAVSLACIVVLIYFFLRIFTVLISVVQELRWTAEAYSGRNYETEKKDIKESGRDSRVTLESPWSDDMEGKD